MNDSEVYQEIMSKLKGYIKNPSLTALDDFFQFTSSAWEVNLWHGCCFIPSARAPLCQRCPMNGEIGKSSLQALCNAIHYGTRTIDWGDNVSFPSFYEKHEGEILLLLVQLVEFLRYQPTRK